MAFKLFSSITTLGDSSRAIKLPRKVLNHTVDVNLRSRAATAISAATITLQGSNTSDGTTGVVTNPTLVIGSSAPEKFKWSTFYYRINNTCYSLATSEATFTAAHAVTAEKYGCIDIYIDAAGTFITVVPLATQAYASAEAAHDAADAMTVPDNKCYVGRILINAEAGNDWNANTDDMTASSDLTTATFLSATPEFYDMSTHAFSAAEITAHRAMFHVADKSVKYVRLYLAALTGTGEIDAWYYPVEG